MSTHQQSSVCRHATPDVGNKIALGVLPCLASPQEMLYVVGLTVACASVHTRTTGTCDEHLRGVFSSEEQYRFHLLSSRNFTGHNRSDKLRLPFSTLLPERRWRGDGCWAFALSTDIWFAPTVTHDNLVARPLITFVAVLHKDGLVRAVKGDLLSTLKNTVIRAWTWARAACKDEDRKWSHRWIAIWTNALARAARGLSPPRETSHMTGRERNIARL